MSGQDGSIRQRHLRTCPRDGAGVLKTHKCRGPWGFVVDAPPGPGRARRLVDRSGFDTKQAARVALRAYLDQRDSGIDDTSSLKVGEFLDQWLTGKRALRPSTVKSYREHIELYLKPHLGRRRLRELNAQHIDVMLTSVSSAYRKRDLSTATIRRIHSTLRSALNSAVKRRLIPYNPAAHVELAVERKAETTVWTSENVGSFLAAIQESRHYPLFHLALVTGMRRGELAGLRWQDVDLKAGLVRVEQQVVQIGSTRYVGPPKTDKGRRTLPLDPLTVEVMRRHMDYEDRARSICAVALAPAQFVFTNEFGEGLKPEKIGRLFALLSARSGAPKIRLHGLRHTAASLALEAGVPMKVVSERLGHGTTGITADLYTHVSPAVARDAADAIGRLVRPTSRSEK